jgi:hypothetical protein
MAKKNDKAKAPAQKKVATSKAPAPRIVPPPVGNSFLTPPGVTTSPSPAPVVSDPVAAQPVSKEIRVMDITLSRGKVSKSGKKAQYTSVALIGSMALPRRLFVDNAFPETITISGPFQTLGESEQAKAEARNAKRIAKGLKPKPTPTERAAALAAREAKLRAKLERAQAASAKLAGKLGTPASAGEAPATTH